MPCDTIQKSSVKLELRADNKQHLLNALKALGYINVMERRDGISFTTREGVQGNFKDGKLTLTGYGAEQNFDVNPIKKAYSVEVVKTSAKRFGWNLQQDKQSQFKFVAQKRGF